MASKALAKQESPTEWALTTVTPDQVTKSLQTVTSGPVLRPMTDLTRLKVPGAGGGAWEVQTKEGKQHLETFDAIILHQHEARKFWSQPFGEGESSGPDCESNDGVRGVGMPGGLCASCAYNKRAQGREQVCSVGRILYLLLPDTILPTVLWLPLMSLANFREYLKTELAQFAIQPYEVVTRFGLVQRRSQGGIAYSAVTFQKVAVVEKATLEAMAPQMEAFTSYVRHGQEEQAALAKELTDAGRGGAQPADPAPEPAKAASGGDDDIPF